MCDSIHFLTFIHCGEEKEFCLKFFQTQKNSIFEADNFFGKVINRLFYTKEFFHDSKHFLNFLSTLKNALFFSRNFSKSMIFSTSEAHNFPPADSLVDNIDFSALHRFQVVRIRLPASATAVSYTL